MRQVVASWTVPFALLALLAVPPAHAGTAAAPDIADPAGDVQYQDPVPPPHPCAAAVDLLSLWVEWTAQGAAFHYTFSDLVPVEDHPEQDFTGRCFYSYADFVLTRADGSKLADSLYVDHWANPAFDTGWRFFLSGSGDEAAGTVDAAAGTIDVLVPLSALGEPGPGDVLGMFRVQSTTQFVSGPVVADFATDFSPDGEPCACPVPFPGTAAATPAGNATPPAPSASQSASRSSSTAASASSSTTAAADAVRPPVPPEDAGSSSGPAVEPAGPAKESPAALWAVLVAALVALAVRRRLA